MDQEPSGSEGDRDYETGIQIARETLTGDIRDALLKTFKNAKLQPLQWSKMTEGQQQGVIDLFSQVADTAVARCARIVAADGRLAIDGTVEKVDVKDGKHGSQLKVTVITDRTQQALMALGMAVGTNVGMLIQDVLPYRGERAPARPEPDQPNLDLAGRIDLKEAPKADDGMTANAGEPFEMPPLADETPRLELSCELGARVRIQAVQFAAHSLAIGIPPEGVVTANYEDPGDAKRCTSVIFTAPTESELDGVDFAVSLLDDTGKATADVLVVIRYAGEAPADADPAPQPGPDGDVGETFGQYPHGDANGDAGHTNGHADEVAQAGEEEAGPTADLAGPSPPPPAARGIRRGRGRRPTTH